MNFGDRLLNLETAAALDSRSSSLPWRRGNTIRSHTVIGAWLLGGDRKQWSMPIQAYGWSFSAEIRDLLYPA
jgi:hypothetical protein